MASITWESSGTVVTSGGLVAPDEDSPSILVGSAIATLTTISRYTATQDLVVLDVVLGARSKGLFTTRRVALLPCFWRGGAAHLVAPPQT